MLKKEHIKQAINVIAGRDPEIGYTLDQMLGLGRIEALPPEADATGGEDFYFLFDRRPVRVKKSIFINEGTVPIEQQLLIKYGEMAKKQELLGEMGGGDYHGVTTDIHMAGLKLMVIHEIDYAIKRLEPDPETPPPEPIAPKQMPSGTEGIPAHATDQDTKYAAQHHLITFLEALKQEDKPLEMLGTDTIGNLKNDLVYLGSVDVDMPACFKQFPFCMDALMQVADINMEFFHVRFIIDCLIRGVAHNLFSCVVDDRIEGMVYLAFKQQYLYQALEIKYIATVRGRPSGKDEPRPQALKGVGTFLVAGVWILWKTYLRSIKDLLLDSEIGARQFYETIGFQPRGFSGFVMKIPRGRLVSAIVDMASRCPDLNPGIVGEITPIIQKQFKILLKKSHRKKKAAIRAVAIETVKTCLAPDSNPAFTSTAIVALNRYRKKIPEAADLIQSANERIPKKDG